MPQEIIFDEKVRAQIKAGVDQLANAVKITLGPRGRNVILQRKFGLPIVTKDGVTVAKEIHLPDKFADIGAQMVREVASRTNELAGDGTTTATVLAQAIYAEGLKYVTAGANPMDLKRGIDMAIKQAVTFITETAQKVQSEEQISQVAFISANGDHEIGSVVTKAINDVGLKGRVSVMDSKTGVTYVEPINGFNIDRGYISPYFVTNTEKDIVEYTTPYILIYEGDMAALKPLQPILEKVAREQRQLLIICNKIEGDALAALAVNNMHGNLRSCAILSPGFSHRRGELLQDLALSVGATIIGGHQTGIALESCQLSHLGTAEKVIVTQTETTIIGGNRNEINLSNRLTRLQTLLKKTTDEFEKESLQNRIANITGSVSVIHVGAYNEIELHEKKDRIEDALNATRAALEEGIIPGGGVTYIHATDKMVRPDGTNDDQIFGFRTVKNALTIPTKQIADNAGKTGAVVVESIQKNVKKGKNFGYNAQDDIYGDLMDMGIIDTTKVARVALENAGSIAGLLLTTECLIASDDNTSTHF